LVVYQSIPPHFARFLHYFWPKFAYFRGSYRRTADGGGEAGRILLDPTALVAKRGEGLEVACRFWRGNRAKLGGLRADLIGKGGLFGGWGGKNGGFWGYIDWDWFVNNHNHHLQKFMKKKTHNISKKPFKNNLKIAQKHRQNQLFNRSKPLQNPPKTVFKPRDGFV
jgi:hypothetical protein